MLRCRVTLPSQVAAVVLVLYTDTVCIPLLLLLLLLLHASLHLPSHPPPHPHSQILIAGIAYWFYRRNRNAAA